MLMGETFFFSNGFSNGRSTIKTSLAGSILGLFKIISILYPQLIIRQQRRGAGTQARGCG
ncbi:hypothetical protein BDV36DRAFT_269564 [Aspergillus pseudocaelatus]|uniref:Uncharacterized protein n=1 Tax=Aspergillus pseudocaelatus TaxID=1825620 RepID=A0ABQ6W921_9EURO|nr:hypothetical protein BDV36DRAFT_269564 [Aspergillus pseudocaelatus]